jgi:hypothetical protein
MQLEAHFINFCVAGEEENFRPSLALVIITLTACFAQWTF